MRVWWLFASSTCMAPQIFPEKFHLLSFHYWRKKRIWLGRSCEKSPADSRENDREKWITRVDIIEKREKTSNLCTQKQTFIFTFLRPMLPFGLFLKFVSRLKFSLVSNIFLLFPFSWISLWTHSFILMALSKLCQVVFWFHQAVIDISARPSSRCFIPNLYAALCTAVLVPLICLVAVGVIFIHVYQVTQQWKAYDDIYRGRTNGTGTPSGLHTQVQTNMWDVGTAALVPPLKGNNILVAHEKRQNCR